MGGLAKTIFKSLSNPVKTVQSCGKKSKPNAGKKVNVEPRKVGQTNPNLAFSHSHHNEAGPNEGARDCGAQGLSVPILTLASSGVTACGGRQ